MDTQNLKSRACLSSFIKYCVTHPEERFWQALRNWSGYHYIIARDVDYGVMPIDYTETDRDTFNIEGRRHDGQ